MRIATNFKPDDLPEEQARTLSELLDDMDFNDLPEQMVDNPSMPDQFTYMITVETKKWEHTVPEMLLHRFRCRSYCKC
jgi:hypothetical protein